MNVKEICDLYNTDLIASIAFGLRSYSLRNKQTELGSHCRDVYTLNFTRVIDLCVIYFLPKFVSLFRRHLLAPAHADFLRRTVSQVIEERERNGILRNDLVEMLLTLKMEAALNRDRTHFTHQQDYLVAQAAMFELTGIESCAMTMTFALYELAKQPLLQARLRAEIRQTLGDAQAQVITYDKVGRMRYLAMVVDETLRKYPNVPILERECTPINKKRFVSLRPYADCFVRRGMPVYISNLAIHHDPQVGALLFVKLHFIYLICFLLLSLLTSIGPNRRTSIRNASRGRTASSKCPCRICPSAPVHTTASAWP